MWTVITVRVLLALDLNTAPAQDMRWDWRDMIGALDLQGGGHAFYNYGIDKQRTRKRLKRNGKVTDEAVSLCEQHHEEIL